MKILKIIGNYLFGFVAILLLLVLFFTFINKDDTVAKIGNYSFLQVEGNSMYPSIKNGDLIVIDRRIKSKYEVGDIVSFISNDGSIITHEIIEIKESNGNYSYFTKGENNNYQDNDHREIKQIIGEYEGVRIPLLGYVVRFGSSTVGYILLVIVPLLLIFIYAASELYKEFFKKRGEI